MGNNLNQIMKRANAIGLLDVPQLRKALEDNRAVEKRIADAYTTPPTDMAVTSIWPIHGRVDKVIDYARNPKRPLRPACRSWRPSMPLRMWWSMPPMR